MENQVSNRRGYLNEDFHIFHLKDQRDMEFEFHHHEFNKITILISGNAAYLIEGKTYKLKPWDIILINSNEIHKVIVDSKEPYERIIIWINSEFLQRHKNGEDDLSSCFYITEAEKNNLLRLNFEELNKLKAILDQFEEAQKSSEFGAKVLRNCLFLQLMVFINRTLINGKRQGSLGVEFDENINRILDYINSNLSGDLSIEKIAERFYISKYYLMHSFKKQTGYTIHNYIVKKRLIMASSLIKEGRSVTEVCTECGFEDYSNFIRAYKKMFGISPKKYFKENLSNTFYDKD